MHLINKTACELLAVPTVSQHDENILIICAKATFDILISKQKLKFASDQQQIHHCDLYWGEPDSSSVRYSNDIALRKPGTDVAVVGNAYAPGGSATAINAQTNIGQLSKTISVFGDRRWQKTAVGYELSKPESFSAMPLIYENAYGGSYIDLESGISFGEPRNPVGKGLYHSNPDYQPDELRLPNLELPGKLLSHWQQEIEPCGTGFIPPNWMPRNSYIGTYDDKWQEERSPLLPRDYDDRAQIAGSTGLVQHGFMSGGEPVELINLHPDGDVRFKLPSHNFELKVSIAGSQSEQQLEMNTVVIEPDENRVSITWCANVPIHWNLSMIDFVRLSMCKSSKGSKS